MTRHYMTLKFQLHDFRSAFPEPKSMLPNTLARVLLHQPLEKGWRALPRADSLSLIRPATIPSTNLVETLYVRHASFKRESILFT